MNLKIDEIGRRAVIYINPDDYFLVKCDDKFLGDYGLAPRIDMSYAGKDDQMAAPSIYLNEDEAAKFRALGIAEIL